MSGRPHSGETIHVRLPGEGERREQSRVRVPVLTILYHPDTRRVGERFWFPDGAGPKRVALSRLAPEFTQPEGRDRRPLADPYLSRAPIHFATASGGGLVLEVGESSTQVVADGELVSGQREIGPGELDRGVVLLLSNRVVLLLHRLAPPPELPPPIYGLIGDSEEILRVREEIRRVADLDVPVLLRGETGTGKELVARALYRASPRREEPYLSVNLGAVPPSLAAAELFGAVKGAFTGADRNRLGFFRRAHGGTLFLDEVGEASAEVQALLLRVLENGEIQPVGATDPVRVDVRVLAATDADLEAAIEEGRFRAPLLHRLSAYQIRVPPLAERRDDIGRLLVHFLRHELAAIGEAGRLELPERAASPWMPASIVARLARYAWPGNVRELKNLARQMVIESRGADQVRVGAEIERVLRQVEKAGEAPDAVTATGAPAPPAKRYRSPAEVDEEELLAALAAHRYRIKPTAAALGVSRSSLYDLIERSSKVRKAADLTATEIEASRDRCAGDLGAMVDDLGVSPEGLVQRARDLELEPL